MQRLSPGTNSWNDRASLMLPFSEPPVLRLWNPDELGLAAYSSLHGETLFMTGSDAAVDSGVTAGRLWPEPTETRQRSSGKSNFNTDRK